MRNLSHLFSFEHSDILMLNVRSVHVDVAIPGTKIFTLFPGRFCGKKPTIQNRGKTQLLFVFFGIFFSCGFGSFFQFELRRRVARDPGSLKRSSVEA